jgi:glycosyltransferase involved in cell wall biosynthesis
MEWIEVKEHYLCLNMIVKNESHIIKNTLAKLLNKIPHIDYWVISDTGSTDNTKEIILDFFKERNMKGELIDDVWKNFGHNRTKALNHAFNKSKYVLVFDADDEICGNFVLPKLTKDSYQFQFGDANGTSYTRTQIINNKKHWKYVGILHEMIICIDSENISELICGNYYTVSGKSGNRSLDSEKYLKDALMLETAYKEAIVQKDDIYNRYGFYCANSYFDCGRLENAIKWYKITIQNNNWSQEKYVACQRLYQCYRRLNQTETGMFYLVKSFEYDKERVECLYELVSYYCANNMNEVAYGYYTIVKTFYETNFLRENLHNKLFLDVSKANLFLPYYMILVSDKVKEYDTTIQMYIIIFTKKHIERNKFYIGNMLYNLQFFIEKVTKLDFFVQLFQEYIDFLISIDYPVNEHDFMYKYEKYGIVFSTLSEPIFSLNDCIQSNKLLFYTGYSPFKWNHTYSIHNALGGSETAVAWLARSFPKQYEIFVAGDVEEEKIENITYVHFNNLANLIKSNAFHSIIVSRYVNFYELYTNFSAYQTFIWGHDVTLYAYQTDLSVESILTKWSSKITGCICQTEWHKDVFLSSFPQLKDKITVINNGIDTQLFHLSNNKIENQFIYTSCSERGLTKLIQLWPSILENLPDAQLFISSYNHFPKSDEDNEILKVIKNTPSITHLGKLNRTELYNLMSSAEYWLYPSYFQETSCITSLELLASEVICLYYPIAGLINTLGDYGIPISEGNEIKTLIHLTIKQKTDLKKKGKKYALNCSWKNRAQVWTDIILTKRDIIPKWCFYYQNFNIETISQFIKNQFNHNNIIYEIIISNNKYEIINSHPDRVTFIYVLFDESILNNINNCEFSILQTEPLNLTWRLNSILEIHNKFPQLKIYDYSKTNIKILNNYNITNCEYLSYNIHSKEHNKLISFIDENKCNQIYDFGLIYNWTSLPIETQQIINPPRRRNVVDFLKKYGFTVNIVAGYEDDRDVELSKCKFILNIHGQINDNPAPSPEECSNIFEHIRCDRLLESGYNILSETSYELDNEYIKKHNKHLTIINYNDFFDISIINKLIKN